MYSLLTSRSITRQARRTGFEGGAMEGGSGVLRWKIFQKLKPIASISGHLVPFQCNCNERLFLQQPTIGDKDLARLR